MAVKLSDKPNVEAPSTEYPFGSIQDKISMVQSGTPVNRLVYNDMHQFFEKLCDYVSKNRNGRPDNGFNGFELFEAMLDLIETRKDLVSEWLIQTSSQDNTWVDIDYGAGLFVAVSSDGVNRVMTSPDGVTWTNRTAPLYFYNSIAYGNGLFIIGGDISGLTNDIATSTDGITWTASTTPFPFGSIRIKFINGKFWALMGSVGNINSIWFSTDGLSWTMVTHPAFNNPNDITYGNGLYIVITNAGTDRVMTSPDGITWTLQTVPVNRSFNRITYGNGLFVAISGTSGFATISNDGINWTDQAIAANIFTGITYGAGKFIAISRDAASDRSIISKDGINWTSLTTNTNRWNALKYIDGLFVAVAYTGTGDRVMTTR
jgi:hypothetical protein